MESSGDTKCLKIIMSSPHWQNKTTVLDKHLRSLLMNLFWYLQFCFSHNQNLNNVFNSCYNALVLNLDTILKIPSISCKPKQPLVQHLTSHIHSPSIYLLFGFFFFFILSHPLSKLCITNLASDLSIKISPSHSWGWVKYTFQIFEYIPLPKHFTPETPSVLLLITGQK